MILKSSSAKPLRVPKHVAIIMDGNGRWARKRLHPRVFGHIRGTKRVKEIVSAADELGVKALTLYAFSTENWSRPSLEIGTLWKLFKKSLRNEVAELNEANVRLRVIGELHRMSPDLREVIDQTMKALENNTGLQLTICISYGARTELARAATLFAEDCVAGKRKPSEMSEALMREYLWTRDLAELSDVDLVIRTGREKRVSNFLLWQAAYAEFIFSDLLWPDFEPKHLQEAVEEYSGRERRFGNVGSDPAAESEKDQQSRIGTSAL